MPNQENDNNNDGQKVNLARAKQSHLCKYWIVKRSLNRGDGYSQWVERCKCGRSCAVDYRFFFAGSNSPRVTKSWFDRDGNLIRQTGNGHDNTKSVDNKHL